MQGYYLYPDIDGSEIIFVSDDDVWKSDIKGNKPQRLTSGFGNITNPRFSRDGKWIAFRGQKGNEVNYSDIYIIPRNGGPARRLTYTGSVVTNIAGWTPDNNIVISSDYGTPFRSWSELYSVDVEGGEPSKLPFGRANRIVYEKEFTLIARNSLDLTYWKRYKGGTRGKFWIDKRNKGIFEKFLEMDSNLTSPMMLGNRVFFISDHEGIGNLYSVDLDGKEVQRHTDFKEFYARNANTDGRKIIFHAGGDIFLYHPTDGSVEKIDIDLPSSAKNTLTRFVDTDAYLEEYGIHPSGNMLSLIVRGRSYVMGNWEGPVLGIDSEGIGRRRLSKFTHTGDHIITVSDSSGDELLEIHNIKDGLKKIIQMEFGIIELLEPSPKDNKVVIGNNRFELILVDTEKKEAKTLDRSDFNIISEAAWSPDGKWISYTFPESRYSTVIKIANVETGEVVRITNPGSVDFSPSFDPDGKYLYYLSKRSLDPVYDKLVFDLGYPMVTKPYAVTLRKDVPSPFEPVPSLTVTEDKEEEEKEKDYSIDAEGIMNRSEAFPVEAADYRRIIGIPKRAFFLSFPVEGSMKYYLFSREMKADGILEFYDLSEHKKELFVAGITDFDVSANHKNIALNVSGRIRVVKSEEKMEERPKSDEPGRESGWIDIFRIKCKIEPRDEWKQMFREAWRLMRENYWNSDKVGENWNAVYEKYSPLLERINSRFELSDVIREMQGELGTSHAYEIGGEVTDQFDYPVGSLGAELIPKEEGYQIGRIYSADVSNEGEKSPLLTPGIDIRTGDVVLEINGEKLSKRKTPNELLLNHAEEQVTLKMARNGEIFFANVKTAFNDKHLLYRSWVENRRNYVHEKSGGRIGYLHIPDMGPVGYNEFTRLFSSEAEKDGLIVDERFNAGGHVSPLILEKLLRKRIGYDKPRRGKMTPYPEDSVNGPVVAIANELAGSDGDIFGHAFKLFGLGPLVGTRTWGGVVGINPSRRLVDGTIITQPEFAFWFKDVGWGVENYGTDPDIEVEIKPQDYAAGNDPQLDRSIQEALNLLEKRGKVLEEPKF